MLKLLKLKIRVCKESRCAEVLGIANSGFIGEEPEILLPQNIVRFVLGEEFSTILVERVLADGSKILMPKSVEVLDVYAVAEDRVVGPVQSHAYVSSGGLTLLNDKLLSGLRISIIDPGEGLWCFRDELGLKVRKGY